MGGGKWVSPKAACVSVSAYHDVKRTRWYLDPGLKVSERWRTNKKKNTRIVTVASQVSACCIKLKPLILYLTDEKLKL